jgi:hypothetical protein
MGQRGIGGRNTAYLNAESNVVIVANDRGV